MQKQIDERAKARGGARAASSTVPVSTSTGTLSNFGGRGKSWVLSEDGDFKTPASGSLVRTEDRERSLY